MKHRNSSKFFIFGFVILFLVVILSGVAFAEEGRDKIETAGDGYQNAGEEQPVLDAEPTPGLPETTDGAAPYSMSSAAAVTVTLGQWRNLRPTESYLQDVSLLPGHYEVDCTSPDQKSKGWIVGNDGVILSYCNGVWDHAIVVESVPTSLYGVQAINPELGVAVGEQGAVLMYLWDRIAQDWVWTKSPIPVGNQLLYRVSMVSDGKDGYIGWAVGGWDSERRGALVKGVINSTTINGQETYDPTWENLTNDFPDLPDVDYYYGVQMLSPNDGWATGGSVGEKGVIIHWDGNEWSLFQEVGSNPVHGIHMISKDEGWTVGSGGEIYHFNGSSWTEVPSPTSTQLVDISFSSDGVGWAVGLDGVILKYVDGDWISFNDLRSDPIMFRMLDFTSGHGWLVGYNSRLKIGGNILEYTEDLWLSVTPPTDNRLNDVSIVSDTEAWAVGTADDAGGTIIHWDGKHWQRWYQNGLPIPSVDLYAVKMVSATDGWAAGDPQISGDPAVFLRWDGHRWYQPRFEAPINVRINAIDLLSEGLDIKFGGWAVADNGNAVAKWDGEADYWSANHTCFGSYYRLRDTSIVTSTVGIFGWDAWAVGSRNLYLSGFTKGNDYFMRYTDGCSTGYAWDSYDVPWACLDSNGKLPDPDDGPKRTYLRGIGMRPGPWGYAVGNYNDRAVIHFYDGIDWTRAWCEHPDSDYRPSQFNDADIVPETGTGWFGGYYTSPISKRKIARIQFRDADGFRSVSAIFPVNGKNIYDRPVSKIDMLSDTMGWAVGDGEDPDKISVIYQYPYPNFTLDIYPEARAVIPGNATTFTVTVNSIGGFSADVSLSVTNLPEGFSVDIDPDTVNEETSGIITVQTAPTTALGTYEIPLHGYTIFRSGDNDIPVWRTTYLLLTVTNTPIYSVDPDAGPAGTKVAIRGENFGSDPGGGNRSTVANHVILAGQQMPDDRVTSWSDTKIEVSIPDNPILFPQGPTLDEVSITANNSQSNNDFTFQLENYINKIATSDLGSLIQISLSGTSFGKDPGSAQRSTIYEHVRLNDEWISNADVQTWSNSLIIFTVPADSPAGRITVTSNGYESNGVSFQGSSSIKDIFLPLLMQGETQ